MPTLSPSLARHVQTTGDAGANLAVYLDAAKATDTGFPQLAEGWQVDQDFVLHPGVGQNYTSPLPTYANGVYLLAYDLSAYDFSDLLKLTLKFDTSVVSLSMNEEGSFVNMQTRVWRTGYFAANDGQQNVKSAAWPNPAAGDAYVLLDEVALPNSDFDGQSSSFTHSVDVPVNREHLDTSQQLWLMLIEKDHYDLTDPSTLTGGAFFYKSSILTDPPVLEVSLPTVLSATIYANGDVDATLTIENAEPAYIYTQSMQRAILFDSRTSGSSMYEAATFKGAANYQTPVVPSKRLVPRSNLYPSAKEAY